MAARICPFCGGELKAEILGGLCPRCVLKQTTENDAHAPGPPHADHDAAPDTTESRKQKAKNGNRFGDYELLEEIGCGGMGVVYKARQKSLNRIVALKMMLAGQFAKPEFVQRFRAEAEAIAQLQHPNIVAIHEVGEREGQPYFSMDYVQGRTLAEIVREGPLPAPRAATYLKAIAEAVHYAHQHDILHRDLKPSNVLIDASDQPRITDFGLAKRMAGDSELTLTGEVLGSPNYLAPEQAAGRQAEVGPASDVYALGAMLYHLVTGRPPFQADSLTTLLRQVMETEPVAPRLLNASVPRDLETICLKCLEKEPLRRCASAQAVADELGRFLEKKPILARPVGLAGKTWRWCRRKPALATALGAVALVAGIGFVGILTQWRQAKASELIARQNAYAADMNLAQRALEANDVRLAVSLLNKHRPAPQSKVQSPKSKVELATHPASSKPSTINQQPSTDLRGWEWRYLWQLCQPDESIKLQAIPGSLGEMALSQDGKVMAVHTDGDKIDLWDLTTRRQMAELPGPVWIEALALSTTGNRLAASTTNALGKPTVEVWDLNRPVLRTTLHQPTPVRSLAFSPDETLLATFGSTGNVAVVEWASNRTVTNHFVRHPRHGGAGMVAFSPEGSRVAVGEDYGWMSLLNWRTGAMLTLTNLSYGAEPVTALAFSPTTSLLAVGFASVLRLWDFESGQPRGQLTNQTGLIRALAFSADGQLLALSSSDRTIRVLRSADQAEVCHWRGHEGEGWVLAFLPDGKTLVSACDAATACFWDVTGTNRHTGHGSLGVSHGLDTKVEVPPQGFTRAPLDPRVACRFGLTFMPDGRDFITTDRDGVLGVWDTRSAQRTEALSDLGSNYWGVALSPDGHWLAAGNASEKVHIWNWKERSRVKSFDLPFEWLGNLRFSRSGRFLWGQVMLNDWTTRSKIWRTEDWQELSLEAVDAADIWWADFSPDDRRLVTGHRWGAVKLWSFPSGRHEITFTNQTGPVAAVFFSPDGRRLASASMDGTVLVRDLAARKELATLQGHSRWVWGAAFSPDGRRLATGGTDTREAVKLWDLATQRELLALHGEGKFFTQVAFSPDGGTLMAISFTGVAHLWRAPSWEEIEAAENGVVRP